MTQDPGAAAVAERRRLRRRNTGIAFVFAAALCILGAVAAVGSLRELGAVTSPEPDRTLDTPAASGTAAPPAGGEAPPAAAPVTFSSPTGNIGCSLTAEAARCDIVDKTWDPGAPPAECTATWGVGVQLRPDGASLVCAADSVLGSATQLAYGATAEAGNYRCTSTEAGVRCEDLTTGRGFALARNDYTLF